MHLHSSTSSTFLQASILGAAMIAASPLTKLAASDNALEMQYLDTEFPGLVPKVYAPGMISRADRFEQSLTLRKNGAEHYFTLSKGRNWTYDGIVRARVGKDGEIEETVFTFSDTINPKRKGIRAGEASFSLDGKTMYFVADYPTNIWRSIEDETGNWSAPEMLPAEISEGESEWYPTIAPDSKLYYSDIVDGKGTIHSVDVVGNTYGKPTKLEATFNYDCGDQVFSPKMDYIIFISPREGGYGEQDLYVAFRDEQGNWSDGVNMGEAINTEGFEFAPFISSDNRFLFFSRRDKWKEATYSDIYWVDLAIIEQYR